MKNALNWFEIPAEDLTRATKFYGTIFDAEFTIHEAMPGFKMAQFPHEGGVGGGIIQGEGYAPRTDGSLVYLNGGDDLSGVEWDHRDWHSRKAIRERLFWLSVEACLDL